MPKKQSVRSNRVCFTLNNYTEEEITLLSAWITLHEKDLMFAVVGKEKGESGTPHLQGFLHLKSAYLKAKNGTVSFWKQVPGLLRAHFESARGTDEDSKKYCSKDGDVLVEFGIPSEPKSIWDEVANAMSLEEVKAADPEIYVKYFFQVSKVIEKNNASVPSDFIRPLEVLRDWQMDVLARLKNQNDRNIMFVIDYDGAKGKSALANHLVATEGAFLCTGGKEIDLTYAFKIHLDGNPQSRYAIIDMARCNEAEFWPWNFMEQLKNCRMMNRKYAAKALYFHCQRVVVFCNKDVEQGKLSNDRLNDVIYI